MKLLYLECNMGAAGDMLMGALYELLSEKQQQDFLSQMNRLGIPGVTLSALRQQKCGIYGTHMQVSVHGAEEGSGHTHTHMHGHTQEHSHAHAHAQEQPHNHSQEHSHGHSHVHTQEHSHTHTHSHSSYSDLLHQISHLPLTEEIKAHAAAVYRLIGEAEAKAHQTTLEQIHFHEVGTLDALADVIGCCLLIELLHPDKILASPVHVGSGSVHCAHGILPVPAPATAEILKEVPIYGGALKGELCTPTGAALLKHFVQEFCDLPPLIIQKTGYGMGTKDFPQANCVRAFLGTDHTQNADCILALSCNLDDITGEALAFAMEELMSHGALDVYTTPVFMKKGRPGQLFTCLCRPSEETTMTDLIFRHTTTRGIRVQQYRRHVLSSSFRKQDTPYGSITLKQSEGHQVCRVKPEYEDLARIAREQGLSLSDLCEMLSGYPKMS